MLRALPTMALLGLMPLVVLPGCGAEPAQQAIKAPKTDADDDWKSSAVWLYATDGARGGHAAECSHVYQLLQEEARCKGELCKGGAELAGEWLKKCSKLDAEHAEEVGDLQAQLSDRADERPTECADQFAELTGEGCLPDSCVKRAQRWATECAETEAGPLSAIMMERAIRRKLGDDEAVRLDLRSCAGMGKLIREGARCADEAACKKAWPDVEAYQGRCEQNTVPDLATGVAQLAITLGAVREPGPVQVTDEPKTIEKGQVPLRLADGSGAILGVCHRRAVELSAYLEARSGCPGARLSVAQVFTTEEGVREVRVGYLLLPEGVELTELYPWLEVTGENEQQAKRRAAAANSSLQQALGASGDAALSKLMEFVDQHGPWIRRSDLVAKALRAHDDKLEPLLERIGKAKGEAGGKLRDPGKLRGLSIRARKRPFADLRRDGGVEVGAATGGYWLDASKLWPKAMAAYKKGLAPLERALRNARRLTGQQVNRAKKQAREHARACAAALEKQREAEQQLGSCVFSACDNAGRDTAVQQLEQSRQAADKARLQLDAALGLTGATASDSPVARKEGCKSDRW